MKRGHDLAGVAKGNEGGVRVCPVYEDLQRRALPIQQMLPEARLHDECEIGAAAVEVVRDVLLRVGDVDNVEAACGDEAGSEVAARLAAVEIEHGRRDVVDRKRCRIAVDDHLHDQRHNDPEERPAVALQFQELLDEHRGDAFEHGVAPLQSRCLRNARTLNQPIMKAYNVSAASGAASSASVLPFRNTARRIAT